MATSPYSALALRETAEGTEVPVRVAPRAKRSAVKGLWQKMLRVQVAAPPREGQANEALCAFLARLFGVSRGSVELRKGQRSKGKVVLIRGLGEEKIRSSLAELR